MVITYSGLAFVRLSFGNMVIGLNPITKNNGTKVSRFGADIAMSALNDPDFNGLEGLNYANKEPFVITGPGEYEYSEIFIKGYPSVGPKGKINTIYSFILDGMKVVHLGVLADKNIAPDILEEISGADILFAPAGDKDTLGGKESAKFATSLEPDILIPILYGDDLASDKLKEFLDEAGEPKESAVEKLQLKKKDIDQGEMEVKVLKIS